MASQSIALNLLRRPKNYLRGRINAEYVRKLEADAREAMTTTDDRKTLHASRWPFPSDEKRIITVRKVEEAPSKEGGTPTIYYEIIDGVNRVEAARALYPKGEFDVPVQVKTYASDAEAFADQIRRNADERGLYLDRDARNKGILILRDSFKMPVRRIAALTGISHASVVRIGKGKQGKGETGKRSKAAKARHAGKRQRKASKAHKVAAWSAAQFIRQCESLSRDYDDHQPEIAEMMKKRGERASKVNRPFAEFIDTLAG